MHKRLEDRDRDKSTSLAYDEDRFRGFCKKLCQHRTLALIISRMSTAVFSYRPVAWEDTDDFGPSKGMLLRSLPQHRVKKFIPIFYFGFTVCTKLTGGSLPLQVGHGVSQRRR